MIDPAWLGRRVIAVVTLAVLVLAVLVLLVLPEGPP